MSETKALPVSGLKSILSMTSSCKNIGRKKGVTFAPELHLPAALVHPSTAQHQSRSTLLAPAASSAGSVAAEERAYMVQMSQMPQVVAYRRTRGYAEKENGRDRKFLSETGEETRDTGKRQEEELEEVRGLEKWEQKSKKNSLSTSCAV